MEPVAVILSFCTGRKKWFRNDSCIEMDESMTDKGLKPMANIHIIPHWTYLAEEKHRDIHPILLFGSWDSPARIHWVSISRNASCTFR